MEVSANDRINETSQSPLNINSSEANDEQQSGNPSVQTGDIVDDFTAYLKNALGGDATAQVNEEELFSALVGQSLQSESEEAGNFFETEKARLMSSMARADGYVSVEDVTMAALRATVAEGMVDQTTASEINGKAFAAAQLDDDPTALFDSFGSEGDDTVATASMEEALNAAKTKMGELESGAATAAPRPLDAQSNSVPNTVAAVGGAEGRAASSGPSPSGSQSMDGAGGFLWKPVSEANGNLVVLLPTALKGMIDRVEIHSSLPPDDTSLLEKGKFAGDTHNGGRPHFRFDSPGSAYGSDIHMVVFKDGGETVQWSIGDGSQRYD